MAEVITVGCSPDVINQMELVSAIMREVDRQHRERHGKTMTVAHRHINVIVAAANTIVDSLNIPFQPSIPDEGLDAWLRSDDTGQSSLWMAGVMFGYAGGAHYAYPHDNADVCRCIRMAHSTRPSSDAFSKLAATGEEWRRIVQLWPQFESAYAGKRWDEMDALLAQCIGGENG